MYYNPEDVLQQSVALDFAKFRQRNVSRLGVFPGTFNPPTRAHLALGQAALAHCDEILFVLPRTLPHKNFAGVGFAERLHLLQSAVDAHPQFAAASSQGGLFLEIAAECRAAYGEAIEISFLCGRDAAERIVGWKYERDEMLAEMFEQFSLLVAQRQGEYQPPSHLAHRITRLAIDGWDDVSATEVRERIVAGAGWQDLVPLEIVDKVAKLYGKP